MFNDASGTEFKKVVIACGYTDGRLGINGLTSLISLHYKLDPYDKGTLFLFCGRRKDRCRAILWEGLSADYFYPHIFPLSLVFRCFLQKNVRIKIERCIL